MSRNLRSISFATVNLYNLQRPGRPMYPRSRLYTEEVYAAKIDWLARAIRTLDADVIAFQELWSAEALADVFEAAGLADDYALAFIKEGAWDGVAVAAAVRAPWEIRAVTRHKDFPEGFRLRKRNRTMASIQADPPAADRTVDPDDDPEFIPSHEDDAIAVVVGQFARSVLQVTIGHSRARRPSVPPIEVFCTHLKSKLATPLDDQEWRNPVIRPHALALGQAISTVRRLAEAAALRIIVDGVLRGTDTPGVVLGDLNDGQFSNALAVMSGQPSFRVAATSRAARRSDTGLYTGVTLQQLRSLGDVYYTHEFKNVLEVIDHVLVSEQFYDWSDKRLWAFREMRILNDHLDAVERISSDHGLVRAAFDWAPVEGASG